MVVRGGGGRVFDGCFAGFFNPFSLSLSKAIQGKFAGGRPANLS